MIELPANVMAHIEDLDEVIDVVHAANLETGVRHAILLVARSHPLFGQVHDLARGLPSYAWGESDDTIVLSLSQAAVEKIATSQGVPFDPLGANEIAVS